MGGRETTPPPLQPSRPQRPRARRRGRRRGKAGGWETRSSAPARGPRRPPPAAHRGENNFQPAASARLHLSPEPPSLPGMIRGKCEENTLYQYYMRIVFPRAPRSGGRREDGMEAAAGVRPQAPPSLPGMALLLSSRLEGRRRILPLAFRESFTSIC